MPGFETSYAGVSLTLPTPELEAWAARCLDPADLRDLIPVAGSFNWPKNLEGLGFPAQPEHPGLVLGRYFYPTGASRWSEYRGLVTATQLAAIKSAVWAVSTEAVPAPFILRADPDGAPVADAPAAGGIATDLYLASARPLTIYAGTGYENLYLVTLVDERYYWQFYSPGVLQLDGAATWNGLINACATALGITLDYDPIDPGTSPYARPAYDSALYCHYEQAGKYLDALAWNVGCVVVRNLDGTYRLQSAADGYVAAVANRTADYNLAGGEMIADALSVVPVSHAQAVLPASVTVTFPKFVIDGDYVDGRDTRVFNRVSYGEVYGITKTLADCGAPYDGYTGHPGTKYLHDTARAYLLTAADVTPQNAAALDALALRLATDYYDGQFTGFDETYQGVRAWAPEAVHDILWSVRQDWAVTRVQRKPWNFGPSEFQHEADGGFGPGAAMALSVVTNACPAFSVIGGDRYQVGETVEYRPLTLPRGSVIGDPYCEDNPFDCCPVPCGDCDEMPRSFSVAFAGMTDNSCTDCDEFNGTYFLNYVEDSSPDCVWTGAAAQLCGNDITLRLTYTAGILTLVLDNGTGTEATFNTGGDPINCLGPNVLDQTDGSGSCNDWPASVTLTPA